MDQGPQPCLGAYAEVLEDRTIALGDQANSI
jgi:hypothetical protein